MTGNGGISLITVTCPCNGQTVDTISVVEAGGTFAILPRADAFLLGDRPLPASTRARVTSDMARRGLVRRRYRYACDACGKSVVVRGPKLDDLAAKLISHGGPRVDLTQLQRMVNLMD